MVLEIFLNAFSHIIIDNMDIQNPRQIILVSCRNVGKDNVLTLSWHTPLSFRPELYGLVMSKKRFSYGMIKESGCFVVNFMPLDMKNEVLYCGTHSGKKVDKFKELVLGKEEAEKIDCPVIKECVAYLECKLVDEIWQATMLF